MKTLQALALTLTIAGLPATSHSSSLKVTTDPPGAAVQIDGVGYGPSPVTVPKLGPGQRQVRVSLEGYIPRDEVIELGPAEDVSIHAPLSPMPKVVPQAPRPAPQAPPAQARATGWPQPAPTTLAAPYASPPPPVQAQGATQPQPRFVPPSGGPKVEATPLPVSQNPTAWGAQKKSISLKVETTPSGASVQVLGLSKEKTSPTYFTGFAAGTITLVVRAPGYQEKRVQVDVVTDSRTHVVLDPFH